MQTNKIDRNNPRKEQPNFVEGEKLSFINKFTIYILNKKFDYRNKVKKINENKINALCNNKNSRHAMCKYIWLIK